MHAPTASSKPCNQSIRMPDPTADDPLEGWEADVQASPQDREVILVPSARKGQSVGEDRRAGVGDAHNLRTQAATDVAVPVPIKVDVKRFKLEADVGG